MKKHIAIAAIIGLAAVFALGQTAKLTAPAPGQAWPLASTQAITWTWTGAAQVKLVLVRQSGGKLGIIKSGLPLSAGAFAWKVGSLEDGTIAPPAGDYLIRVSTMDSKILNASPVFSITEPGKPSAAPTLLTVTQVAVIPSQPPAAPKPITITKPKKGDVWIPLKPYALEWSWTVPMDQPACGGPNCTAGCAVDAWLVPVLPSAPVQKIPLLNQFCCGYGITKGMVTYAGQYGGIVPNLAPGDYFIRVAYWNNPGIYGDSQTFTVKSTLAGDTAFLGPDPLQGQVDLALTNVFFDAQGNLAIRIKNLGARFSGSVHVEHESQFLGSSNKSKEEGDHEIAAEPGEEKNVILSYWDGYHFSGQPWDSGKFIPKTTRPFWATVKITTANDMNSNNNAIINKQMCRIQAADIGTDGEINFNFAPQVHLSISRGTGNSIHEAKLKWLSPDTFEAELEVGLWNYGCSPRTFDCWLYVDKLPGQLIFSGYTLAPGSKTKLVQLAKIKLPGKCGEHRLVFIADPAEDKDQPYPDSYLNNFIPVTLKIMCGGTVTGDD